MFCHLLHPCSRIHLHVCKSDIFPCRQILMSVWSWTKRVILMPTAQTSQARTSVSVWPATRATVTLALVSDIITWTSVDPVNTF